MGISKQLAELGERLTSNYLIITTGLSPVDAHAVLLRVPVATEKKFWSTGLFRATVADSEVHFEQSDSTSTSWRAVVSIYPTETGSAIVADITNWKVMTERGTFKTTSWIDEPKSMEKFFAVIADTFRAADPQSVANISGALPEAIRKTVAVEHLNPGPADIRVGAMDRDPFAYVQVGADGRVVWDSWDGTDISQWDLYIYGSRTMPRGATEFVDDGPAFPNTRYNHKDLKGVLYSTASRLVVYYPFGTNGFMLGTPNADGYVRAGHIRYEWVSEISYSDGTNNKRHMLGNMGRVTVFYSEPSGVAHELTLLLDRLPPEAKSTAEVIRQRVLKYRLRLTNCDDAMRAAAQAPFQHATDGEYYEWKVPGALPAGDGSQFRPTAQ